ncbi:hypothetical protein EST38_g12345 [Candolleomyces aberdarensis]|uniref:Transforming growth factor beta regulator 1 n=1 Tax=Candolleomyces aberdarensis TaxID=2316362 RepID=A0A4Q2D2N2_9AGAR|nr:hypothetical protein EST38_g12345 [Candolleomyces aberdarensis]
MELEKQQQLMEYNGSPGSSPGTLPQASALPRTLLNARARTSFEENLRKAIEEEDEDEEDTLLPPRRRASRDPEPREDHQRGSRRTRAASGKSKASGSDLSPSNGSHSPKTRSKRAAQDDDHDASYGSTAKRHKSRPSISSQPSAMIVDDHLPRFTSPLARHSPDVMDAEQGSAVPQNDGVEASPRATTRSPSALGKHTPTLDNAKSSPDVIEEARPDTSSVSPQSPGIIPPEDAVMHEPLPSSPQVPATVPFPESVSTPSGPPSPAAQDAHQPAPAGSCTAADTEQPSTSGKYAEPAAALQNTSDLPAVPEPPIEQQTASSSTSRDESIATASESAKSLSPAPPAQSTESDATSASAPPGRSPTSGNSMSSNPYLSLSTIMVPKSNNPAGSPTPTSAHSFFMPPYMYYPSPVTPITATPNTPSYAYNPYFYLTAPPMLPSPTMYPPGANVPPTPTSSTQSRPPQAMAELPRAKPKRLKAHTVTSKSYSIPLVPRDKHGKPMLPLNVGIMTVLRLGNICLREHFHTERYIFPVGYEVTRRYLSTINPNIEVVYHCTILDGGDGPKFQIVPADTPDRPVIAGTATGAWSNIVKQANAIRNRQHSNSVSGPDFFGLGQNTIKHLIQQLPNSDRLRDYVWQNFIEGGPLGGRHAAVIPALPEEYDAAVPRGAVYHSPLEREKRLRHEEQASPGELPKGLSHYPQHIIAQAAAQQLAEHQHGTPPLSEQPPAAGSSAEPSTSNTPAPQGETNPGDHQRGQPAAALPATVPTTTLPNGAVITQAPTPITPNTPAPTLASLMQAYRPPPPP